MNKLTVACADIGSIKAGNFGWCLQRPGQKVVQGNDIDVFCDEIASSLAAGASVALGFEAPLFVPVRDIAIEVAKARIGEGNRSWSAGAGTGALATGLVETLYIFRKMAALKSIPKPTFSWDKLRDDTANLFIWEAFVTAAAKGLSHEDDAILALRAFIAGLPDPMSLNALEQEATFSLVGAGLLRAGLSSDIGLLSTPSLVIKA